MRCAWLLMVAVAVIVVGPAVSIGQLPAAPLPVPVWIDTDPAVGEPERDVDDGLALVQAFNSPELDIRGVSVVFGNAPLARAFPIAQDVLARVAPPGVRALGGAAGPDELGAATDASRALAAALRERRLTILALGPATNVATVLRRNPELADRIERVIAVAGRRPGQRFTTGMKNRKGHRDFNFELDPKAFQTLLDSRVPLVLAPFEVSSKVWITATDLDRVTNGDNLQWLVGPARAWLALWTELFDVDGFNPFDTLAVAFLTSRRLLQCEELPIRIETRPDDVTEDRLQGARAERKPYLLVSREFSGKRRARYCYAADPAFKADLIERLRR